MGGCREREAFNFEVDEKLLRTIAAAYVPGEAKAWQFKYHCITGEDWQDRILGAEVAGFLMAVDEYKKEHNFPNPLAVKD
jgi:hypothetical protein